MNTHLKSTHTHTTITFIIVCYESVLHVIVRRGAGGVGPAASESTVPVGETCRAEADS